MMSKLPDTEGVILPNHAFSIALAYNSPPNMSAAAAALSFAVLAIDPIGLIMDACFYNNPAALSGAMVLSPNSPMRAVVGDATEVIQIDPSLFPSHTYAIVIVVMCSNDSFTMGPFEGARVEMRSMNGAEVIAAPISLGKAVAAKASTAVCAVARRGGGGDRSIAGTSSAASAPWRLTPITDRFYAEKSSTTLSSSSAGAAEPLGFMAIYPQILSIVAIDPVMAVELQKRQPVFELGQGERTVLPMGMTDVTFGLGWETRCDLDASCVGVDVDGTSVFMVWFSQQSYGDGIVVHSGDNLTGDAAGDDEQIHIKLSRIPPEIDALYFTVNVYTSGKNFTDVDDEFCRLVDMSAQADIATNHNAVKTRHSDRKGREMVYFGSLDSGDANGIIIATLFRNRNMPQQWIFDATGLPVNNSKTVCHMLEPIRHYHKYYREKVPLPEPYAQLLAQSRRNPHLKRGRYGTANAPTGGAGNPRKTEQGCCVVQ